MRGKDRAVMLHRLTDCFASRRLPHPSQILHVSDIVRSESIGYALKIVRFLQVLLAALVVCVPALRGQEVRTSDRTSYGSVTRKPVRLG
jgi:hypothetical protein